MAMFEHLTGGLVEDRHGEGGAGCNVGVVLGGFSQQGKPIGALCSGARGNGLIR